MKLAPASEKFQRQHPAVRTLARQTLDPYEKQYEALQLASYLGNDNYPAWQTYKKP